MRSGTMRRSRLLMIVAMFTSSLVIVPLVGGNNAYASPAATSNYYLVTNTGTVIPAGQSSDDGALTNHKADIVASFAVPGGGGYWMVSSSGRVYPFGSAQFYGDTYTDGITGLTGSHPLNAPIVGGAPTANGKGYWLVAADGGVFNFGDASFLGSTYSYGITGLTGSHPLNAPIVGMVADPTGNGYWLVASDGGIFNFGAAPFYGSTYSLGLTGLRGSHPLDAPVVNVYPSLNGQGYYMVAADGGVFNFGDAKFSGSAYDYGYTGLRGAHPLPAPVTSILPNPDGQGYYIACSNGKVIAIGGAPNLALDGSPNSAVVAIVPSGSSTATTPPPPTISQDLAISTSSLPSATVGADYAVTLVASGGTGQNAWSATGLPDGLVLSASGVISGAPAFATSSSASVDVTVTDSSGASASASLSLTVLPQFTSTVSNNWSGYIESGTDFDSASATFTVGSLYTPPAGCNNMPYGETSTNCTMSEWVGIGGNGTSNLIQAGIEESPISGTNEYSLTPWWELLPASQQNLTNFTVRAGDIMYVDIYQNGDENSWTIDIEDETTGQGDLIPNLQYYGNAASAEWITEAITYADQVSYLTPFAGVQFGNLKFGNHLNGGVQQQIDVNMVQNGVTVSQPSSISDDSFSVNYTG